MSKPPLLKPPQRLLEPHLNQRQNWSRQNLTPAAEGTAQHAPTDSAMTQAMAEGAIATVVVDQARTLSWLTGRIEALEAEIATLKQQREQASADVEQSSQLQQEI